MDEYMRNNIFLKPVLQVMLFFLVLSLIFGCSTGKQTKKEPVFDKWKMMAEKSKGYSPSPMKRKDHIPAEKPGVVSTKEEKKPEALPEEKRLPSDKITIKMFDVDVSVLLRALARAADQNIMINENVRGRASISIINTPWDQVFKGLLATNGLDYQRKGDIIRIVSLKDLENDAKMMDARAKKESMKKEYDLKMKSLQAREESLVTEVEIYHVRYADPATLRDNLDKLLKAGIVGSDIAEKGKEKGEIKPQFRGAILVDPHTNSLMIQAVRGDIDRLMPLIMKLDRPTRQVLIEAHIVEATRTTAKELGIQWGGTFNTASGGDTNWFGVDSISGPETIAKTLAEGLTFGFINTAVGRHVLAIQLSALQNEGKANILSSPSITTIDNQKAIIESGKQIPYQTVENKEVKIAYKDATLMLEVTPYVVDDNTIKLVIDTKNDELDWANAVQGNPAVTTRRARTTVVLFDGQTTVIGGLNKESKNDGESGVAGLKDIPIIGLLFKGKSANKAMEDLLIFITPHILKQRPMDGEQAAMSGEE